MENRVYQEEEIEIDLLRLFYAIRSKIWMVIAVGLICACMAAGFTYFFIAPTYTSSSTILAMATENQVTSLSDLQAGAKLTLDYKVLFSSRPVLIEVIENLGLDMEYKDLKDKVEIDNPDDSRILTITVTMSEPELAKAVVDELALVASRFSGEKMEVTPPKIIEAGEVPLYKDGPSMKMNTMIGFLFGTFLVCIIIVVLELLNDSVRTEEDVERYLGIPTLSSVPERGRHEQKKFGRKRKAE